MFYRAVALTIVEGERRGALSSLLLGMTDKKIAASARRDAHITLKQGAYIYDRRMTPSYRGLCNKIEVTTI